MRKFFSVIVILCMALGFAIAANAAPSYRQRVEAALTKQAPVGQMSAPGLQNKSARGLQKAPKIVDRRVITPAMSYRERVEVMRNIKKRAAAMRNQLMLAAELERQRNPQLAPSGIPSVQ
jgi:hypothetical protein